MGFPSEGRGGRPQGSPAKLLRLHRHSLTSLLVTGGQAKTRRAVALSFHDAGPLRRGPFVHVDCGRDEPRLRSALEACLTQTATENGPGPVLAAWGGTLFLDRIASLSLDSQRLLLCLLDRASPAGGAAHEGWPLRFSAGDAGDLAPSVAEGRFLPSLHDGLDKIRVELGTLAAA